MVTIQPTQPNNHYEACEALDIQGQLSPLPACSPTMQDPTLMTLRDAPGSPAEGWPRIEGLRVRLPSTNPKLGESFLPQGTLQLYTSGVNGGKACGYPMKRYGVGMAEVFPRRKPLCTSSMWWK